MTKELHQLLQTSSAFLSAFLRNMAGYMTKEN